MKVNETHLMVEELLGRALHSAQTPQEKELFLTAIDALNFIWSTGQAYAFEDYRRRQDDSDSPPPVVASFKTQEEADSWLNSLMEPPHAAFVLIGGQYHIVAYSREEDLRRLAPHPTMEYHLGRLRRAGLPPALASFDSLQAAEAWLEQQSVPTEQAVVLIEGEPHLAVFYRNINHRAIYSFRLAVDLEAAHESPQLR